MRIDDTLIESLLFEEEGVGLDLKVEQYRFVKANDDEKSELLKDILAFANAWRRSDAYILIGVREVKGGKSDVVGIADLLDDAAIQQFVNSKTQRPITFSYQNISFDGKNIAVIHIPVQQRPFYLKNDFGKLSKNIVYVRRGSATVMADPEEISRMGMPLGIQHGSPELKIYFAEPNSRLLLTTKPSLKSLVLDTPNMSSIPDYEPEDSDPFGMRLLSIAQTNSKYYRQLVIYTYYARLLSPLYLAVNNNGSSTAHDVRIEIKVDTEDKKIFVFDDEFYPDVPKRKYDPVFETRYSLSNGTSHYDTQARSIGNQWLVEARAEKVQPKSTHWFKSPFYIGADRNGEVLMQAMIFCDNLSEPEKQTLAVEIQSERRSADLNAILKLENERFRSSPEWQRLRRQNKE